MTTTTHTRSIHIEAPVAKAFDYIKDPHNFFTVLSRAPGSRIMGHLTAELTDVSMAPDGGVGTTYSYRGALFIFHVDATLTRQEYAVNERIVDHNSLGPMWTIGFAPDDTGTALTLSFSLSSRIPLLDKVEDLAWNPDKDLDTVLAAFKEAIEA